MDLEASLDTAQLVAFLRILREGSFSRAAFSLGIGQPAVSSRIQALEAAVGGPLFTRGRRVALTALGESFVPYARRALEVLSEGARVARLAKAGQRGRVSLGVLGSLAEGLIGPALEEFLRAHPEVECVTRSGDHETILGLLWDGMVELGLVVWPCTNAFAADLSPVLLLKEPVVLVAHPRHPLAKGTKGKTVTKDDVVRLAHPLLLLRWWQTHPPEMVRLAKLTGTHVEIPKETARHLVLAGVGAGFFPRTFIATELERGALTEIRVADVPRLDRTSALVSRRESTSFSPPVHALVGAIKRRAEALKLCR